MSGRNFHAVIVGKRKTVLSMSLVAALTGSISIARTDSTLQSVIMPNSMFGTKSLIQGRSLLFEAHFDRPALKRQAQTERETSNPGPETPRPAQVARLVAGSLHLNVPGLEFVKSVTLAPVLASKAQTGPLRQTTPLRDWRKRVAGAGTGREWGARTKEEAEKC